MGLGIPKRCRLAQSRKKGKWELVSGQWLEVSSRMGRHFVLENRHETQAVVRACRVAGYASPERAGGGSGGFAGVAGVGGEGSAQAGGSGVCRQAAVEGGGRGRCRVANCR